MGLISSPNVLVMYRNMSRKSKFGMMEMHKRAFFVMKSFMIEKIIWDDENLKFFSFGTMKKLSQIVPWYNIKTGLNKYLRREMVLKSD